MKYITWFNELQITDVPLVGGKNASLGQMIQTLTKKGIVIPNGFALTVKAYWHFLEYNNLLEPLKKILATLTDPQDLKKLKKVGAEIRGLMLKGTMPPDVVAELEEAYKNLSEQYGSQAVDVAVRSSATAEDLPNASFAGQQETFLNIKGSKELVLACKKSMASLFTDRAIVYRVEKGFDHWKVGLSVGVQKMVRSDLASAGVLFTLDTETGFKDVIMINASYGLGESVVQGLVSPDEFRVYKPLLKQGYKSIIKKVLGDKPTKLIYGVDKKNPTQEVTVGNDAYNAFSLTDEELLTLARYGVIIEDYYSELKGHWCPMDIEWAKDGLDGKLYIVQARPETVHANHEAQHMVYALKENFQKVKEKIVLSGQSIGQRIAAGKARVAKSFRDLDVFEQGDILVTSMTDPDWVPIMKKAAAIITDRGGRTSHAAIVSRELGIPAIIGTERATSSIKTGEVVTVDCSQGATGYVYRGIVEYTKQPIKVEKIPQLPVKLMVNIGEPERAMNASLLPVDGVGLARVEFIISNTIKMHPMACVEAAKISDQTIMRAIDEITRGYMNARDFFVASLAQGVATIAAHFYPRPVIVRFSDFKSNEYRNLLAGSYYEPLEENPMLGLRGASRYYSALYEPAFLLECAALKKAREEMGFSNIKIMIPFVRTIEEAQKVIDLMHQQGLQRGKQNLELYMMCEIPSNVVLMDQFAPLFDGISIGSNDLTQMTLAVDRDSELLANLFDERDPAVKEMIKMALQGAKRNKIHSGICGQAPSDYPEFGKFLIEQGIDSISLNPDSVYQFIKTIT
ncbi:MAG: phosphoenolpyruvate synthase [Candidatus Babeliales bacterium]